MNRAGTSSSPMRLRMGARIEPGLWRDGTEVGAEAKVDIVVEGRIVGAATWLIMWFCLMVVALTQFSAFLLIGKRSCIRQPLCKFMSSLFSSLHYPKEGWLSTA